MLCMQLQLKILMSSLKRDVIPDNAPDMSINLDHLSKAQKAMLTPIQESYQDIFSRGRHHVGIFPHWQVRADIDPSVNCFQKCRSHELPASAWEDLTAYKENGVFSNVEAGVDHYTANITLTKRPTTKEQKFPTKADRNAAKIKEKEKSVHPKKVGSQDELTSKVIGNQEKVETPRQLYRLSIDYRNVNHATRNDCTINLPTLQSIEQSF